MENVRRLPKALNILEICPNKSKLLLHEKFYSFEVCTRLAIREYTSTFNYQKSLILEIQFKQFLKNKIVFEV